jgi:hypothetical protein
MTANNTPKKVYRRSDTPTVTETTAAEETVFEGSSVHRTTPIEVDERVVASGYTHMALKPMKVNGVMVNPGDIVPEAATWRNVHNYISAGFLAVVVDPA